MSIFTCSTGHAQLAFSIYTVEGLKPGNGATHSGLGLSISINMIKTTPTLPQTHPQTYLIQTIPHCDSFPRCY